MTEERKRQISLSLLGKKQNAESQKKRSESLTGKTDKRSKIILFNNEKYTLINLCRKFNLEKHYHSIKRRINILKWDIENAILTPIDTSYYSKRILNKGVLTFIIQYSFYCYLCL